MKFTDTLLQGLVPEWRYQYVEYKAGKKLIKKIVTNLDSSRLKETTDDRTPLLQPLDPIKSTDYGDNGNAFRIDDVPQPVKKSNVSFKTSIFNTSLKTPEQKQKAIENDKNEFISWLDLEYNKIEAFFKEREQDVYERFLIIEDQLYQLKEQKNGVLKDRKNHMTSSHSHASDGTVYQRVNEIAYHTKSAFTSLSRFELPSLPSLVFLKRWKQRKRKNSDISMTNPSLHEYDINYFENRIRNGIEQDKDNSSIDSDSLREVSLGTPVQEDIRETPEMVNKRKKRDYVSKKRNYKVPFLFARKQLKEAVLEYYRSLILLRSYKELNRTAFRKITKKFDKGTHSKMSAEYGENIDKYSYFMTSDILDKLIFQTEELFISFFDPGSTDRKRSLEKLKSIAYALNNNDKRLSAYYTEFFISGFSMGFGIPLFVLALYTGLHRIFNDTMPEATYLLQIYGGFFLLNMMFLLFGLNLCIFDKFKINYKFIFEVNIGTALDYKQYFLLPSISFALLSILMWFSFNEFWRHEFPGRDWPWIFFGVTLGVFLWPFNQFYASSRKWLQVALFRILLSGFYPVEFRDFFLGDLLCSLTYTMGNISFFFCLYSHHWNGLLSDTPSAHNVCGSSKSRSMGFFAALPSIWRFLQCVRRYTDSGDWFPHLANMVKYGVGATYYCLLSVYRIKRSHPNRVAFIVMATINSVYTSAWDIMMDWSLLQVNSKNWLLRDNLFYKRPIYYYCAMVFDVVLRFQWIFYAFFSHQLQQLAATSFCIALAELLRRIVWVLFRMENEHVTNVILFRASKDSPLPYSIPPRVENAIKKLVLLKYKPEIRDDNFEQASAVSSALNRSADISIDSEAHIGLADASAENLPRLTRRKSTLATVSDVLTKAHIKDFQRRKTMRIDEDSEDDDDDDDDK